MPRPKRERWYSLEGQNRSRYQAWEGSRGTRKIVSLVILLVLVLILIQQTSDTRQVEQVATAIGLLPNPNTQLNAAIGDANAGDTSAGDPSTPLRIATPVGTWTNDRDRTYETISLQTQNSKVKAYCDIWEALLKLAAPATQQKIARLRFADTSPGDDSHVALLPILELDRAWSDEIHSQLKIWLDIESQNNTPLASEEASNDSNLVRFNTWFRKASESSESIAQQTPNSEPVLESESTSKSEQDHEDQLLFQRGFQLALDRVLLASIEDNSPWKSNERLPFLRGWQRTSVLRDALAANVTGPTQLNQVEVSQLMSVASSLRSTPIRFLGTIVRVEPSDMIEEPGFGKTEYEIFWLRPDLTSQQPVKVYAPRNHIDPALKLGEATPVMVCGYFFKRFAYAAQRGPEVAPMLMAAYVGPPTATSTGKPEELLHFNTASFVKGPAWSPPTDLSKPYAIAKERLASAMSGLSVDNADLDSLSTRDDMEIVRPLLAANTLAPEMKTLAESNRRWPVTKQASIARVNGFVTKVETIPLPSEFASLLDRDVAYRCSLQAKLENGNLQKVIILCKSVPQDWLPTAQASNQTIYQPASVNGLLLSDESETPLIMWASQLRWIVPADWDQETITHLPELIPSVAQNRQFLMHNQWDLSWIDTIQNLQTEPVKPLSQTEYEPFFQLIRLADTQPYPVEKATEPIDLKKPRKLEPQSIVSVLEKLRPTNAQRTALERIRLEGRIVRVTSVPVTEPDQVKLLGADRYFQLDLMADVGNRSYEIKTEKEPILYHKEYPVTCVVARLPDWLLESFAGEPGAASATTWYPRKKVQLDGWFYRFWKYKTLEMSQALGDRGRQIGPLVVADSLQSLTIESQQVASPFWGDNRVSILIGLCGVAAIWWFIRTRLNAKPKLKFKAMKGSNTE